MSDDFETGSNSGDSLRRSPHRDSVMSDDFEHWNDFDEPSRVQSPSNEEDQLMSDDYENWTDFDEPPRVPPSNEEDLLASDDDGLANLLNPSRTHSRSPSQEEPTPDPDLIVSLTLREFVAQAKALHAKGSIADFTRFVLTGVYEEMQFQVDPIKDALEDADSVSALRDYDSVLGLHKDICINTFLTVYPVAKFEDTLNRNIHIKYSFTNETVSSY